MSKKKEEQKIPVRDQSQDQDLTGDDKSQERLRRVLADYDNLKKQTEKEKQEFVKFANQVLIENLVGIWEGFGLVNKQLMQLLQANGFEQIKVKEGDQFNPEIMEAVAAEGEGEKVASVVGLGYKLHGKVIRPAKVRVGG